MPVTFAAWNGSDVLSNPATIDPFVRKLDELDSDVVVIPEAYKEDAEPDWPYVYGLLTPLGYDHGNNSYANVFHTLYEDTDDRRDRHGLVVLNRLEGSQIGHAWLCSRFGAEVTIVDPNTNIPIKSILGHWDDRSQDTRFRQFSEAAKLLPSYGPRLIGGDMNELHQYDRRARLIRASREIANYLPVGQPGTRQTRLERVGSLADRLIDMAEGQGLLLLQADGYGDADPQHRPTFTYAKALRLQLDRFMVSREVNVVGFTVHDLVPGFDHHAISASIGT